MTAPSPPAISVWVQSSSRSRSGSARMLPWQCRSEQLWSQSWPPSGSPGRPVTGTVLRTLGVLSLVPPSCLGGRRQVLPAGRARSAVPGPAARVACPLRVLPVSAPSPRTPGFRVDLLRSEMLVEQVLGDGRVFRFTPKRQPQKPTLSCPQGFTGADGGCTAEGEAALGPEASLPLHPQPRAMPLPGCVSLAASPECLG